MLDSALLERNGPAKAWQTDVLLVGFRNNGWKCPAKCTWGQHFGERPVALHLATGLSCVFSWQ